jgi:hypothetical protein
LAVSFPEIEAPAPAKLSDSISSDSNGKPADLLLEEEELERSTIDANALRGSEEENHTQPNSQVGVQVEEEVDRATEEERLGQEKGIGPQNNSSASGKPKPLCVKSNRKHASRPRKRLASKLKQRRVGELRKKVVSVLKQSHVVVLGRKNNDWPSYMLPPKPRQRRSNEQG